MMLVRKKQGNLKRGGSQLSTFLSLDGFQCLQVKIFRLSYFYHHPLVLQGFMQGLHRDTQPWEWTSISCLFCWCRGWAGFSGILPELVVFCWLSIRSAVKCSVLSWYSLFKEDHWGSSLKSGCISSLAQTPVVEQIITTAHSGKVFITLAHISDLFPFYGNRTTWFPFA